MIAIFTGHWHVAGEMNWRGYRTYLTGSPRHTTYTFAVVRITDGQLIVALYNWNLPPGKEPPWARLDA
ncbi:MAG: hypothetical protein ACLFVU_08450 [Phycisphaerae bacterium]